MALGVGAVAIGAGLWMYLAAPKKRGMRLEPAIGPGALGLSMTGLVR